MYWKINPLVKEAEDEANVIVELQWGWTAGMTEDDLKNYADDAPKGFDSVRTTLDMAEELRDDLTKIIDANKQKHEDKRAEYTRQLEARYPMLGEKLEEMFERVAAAAAQKEKKNESNDNPS